MFRSAAHAGSERRVIVERLLTMAVRWAIVASAVALVIFSDHAAWADDPAPGRGPSPRNRKSSAGRPPPPANGLGRSLLWSTTRVHSPDVSAADR
jgi:hypothetical protein